MVLLEWKDEYRTGVDSIDYEHEQLILTINNTFGKTQEDGIRKTLVVDALGEIHALVEAHFALEEKIMRDARYPEYAPHKEDHDRLLEDIRDIMDDVETGRQVDIGPDLKKRMTSWFGIHFATLDRELHVKLGH